MTIHLVRHAEAGSAPHEHTGLEPTGHRQAARVAEVLGALPITRVLSSRYVRCVETVTPLAARLGLAVEQHPALCEEAAIEDTWALLESLTGAEVVVCTHGNVLSPVLDRVHRRGAEIVGDAWTIDKASVWSLEPAADRTFGRATLLTT